MSVENNLIVTNIKELSQISKVTTLEEVTKLDLVNKLREANKHAWIKGCGLAAIQIGNPLRFAWFIFKGQENTLLNPAIITKIGKQTLSEGCLSIPNKNFDVERAYEINYITDGKKKKAKGFKARLIQHEIDHMNGKLINTNPETKLAERN